MSKKQPWKKDYTGYAKTNEGVQVYVENGKIKPVGTEALKILKKGWNAVVKGVDFLSVPPSVRKAREEGTYIEPITYRDTGPGQVQSLAELSIKGVSNIAQNTIDRFTRAPGPVTKDGNQRSVYDTKQDLRIEKDKITQELINELGVK